MRTLVGLCIAMFCFVSVSEAKAPGFTAVAYELSQHPERFEEIDLSFEDIDTKTMAKLLERAEYQSQIWYDTILEGDYLIQGRSIAITAVSALYNSEGAFVAYRIVYSKPAWDYGFCEVDFEAVHRATDEEKVELMKECDPGVIVGSSFVSPNLRRAERDFNAMEEFISNN